MGWKASAIIIHDVKDVPFEELLFSLGLPKLTKIGDRPFNAAINPPDGEVYIGTYKDNLIILIPDLPFECLTAGVSETEAILVKRFPDAEICAIVLHSVVNLWGFSVIQKGQKIRVIAGSADDGTFIEYGDPLPEEKELRDQATLDENGNRVYLLEDYPDEPNTEDQVGEEYVFNICSRYFGERLDMAGDDLFDMIFTGYNYSDKPTPKQIPLATGNSKPWWKFW